MRRQSMHLLPCVVMVSLVLLAACAEEEHQDIKQWMKTSSADMRGRVLPLPEIKPFPIVSYDATDLLDPFSSVKLVPEKKSGGGIVPDFNRPREPLEGYPLESIAMIGIVRKGGTSYALVQASDGTVHQVKAGNHLGQNFGVIVSVSDAEVRITELVQDPSGQSADWIERPASLTLREQAESGPKKSEGKK